MGSYYIKKLKNQKWSLYHQSYEAGERLQERVSDLALLDLGLMPDDPYIKTYEKVKSLNKQNSKENEKIRKAAKRTEDFISLNEDLFPQQFLTEFQNLLAEENFGSPEHLKKLLSHFNFIQKMCIKLKIEPSAYKESSKKIYKYFIEQKISVSYGSRIICILNRWGTLISRKRNKFFEEVPLPRGNQLSAIADAQRSKKGVDTELGVRVESLPLRPETLQAANIFLSKENSNWLNISIWFGLRPEEVDMLKDETKFRLEYVTRGKKKIKILIVYQSKLKSVSKDKRWKKIPILFAEQESCLSMISAKLFKRPLHKTVRKHCGRGITLYGGRKNFVDMMLEKGQRIEDISLWLGHTSIETTWKHYKNKEYINFVETNEVQKNLA